MKWYHDLVDMIEMPVMLKPATKHVITGECEFDMETSGLSLKQEIRWGKKFVGDEWCAMLKVGRNLYLLFVCDGEMAVAYVLDLARSLSVDWTTVPVDGDSNAAIVSKLQRVIVAAYVTQLALPKWEAVDPEDVKC